MHTAPDKWWLLRAHRLAVGLPSKEDMGNGEVGHNALSAGHIFEQGCVGDLVAGLLVNLA
jgi:2,3-bisphosphoglycerate-independent phosphoglycerate mutase